MAEQLAAETAAAEPAAAEPAVAQVAGRAVLLVPHRGPDVGEDALPPEYQKIFAIVRRAGAPVTVKQVGEALGLEVAVRGKLEPLRGKLSKLAGRGWLRKLPDGRFMTIEWTTRSPTSPGSPEAIDANMYLGFALLRAPGPGRRHRLEQRRVATLRRGQCQ